MQRLLAGVLVTFLSVSSFGSIRFAIDNPDPTICSSVTTDVGYYFRIADSGVLLYETNRAERVTANQINYKCQHVMRSAQTQGAQVIVDTSVEPEENGFFTLSTGGVLAETVVDRIGNLEKRVQKLEKP